MFKYRAFFRRRPEAAPRGFLEGTPPVPPPVPTPAGD
jgi:hypothetical protein